MKITVCILLFFVLGVIQSKSQNPQNINMTTNLPKMTPVSPEAASLGKYGQIPVSHYTGVPNISIPLYNIKTGEIQLPISMNYHAGGIKVEEMPSSVGLGWSLSAGGVITRSQRGLDDENGYFVDGAEKARKLYNNQMTTTERDAFLLGVYRRSIDAEADIFYFNVAGMTGKFFITDEGVFVTTPRSDIKVTYLGNAWKLTNSSGIEYIFSAAETTQSTPYCWSSSSGGTTNDASSSVSAWYLTSIRDKNGNQVDFLYESDGVQYQTKTTATRHLLTQGVQSLPDFSYCNNMVTISGKRLKSIHYANGKIVFNRSTTASAEQIYPLSTITVTDTFNRDVKKYQFYTSGFTTSGIGGCEDQVYSRLRLDSIKEITNPSVAIPPYKFTYDATSLPCRLSNAQDHWGYYNGKANSTFVRYQNSLSGPYAGADKSSDFQYAKAGTLIKIDYPTGGSNVFEYEGNSYGVYKSAGFDFENPVSLTGISGDNSNHNNDYIVYFNGSFTVQSSDIDPNGYASINSLFSFQKDNNPYFHVIYATIYGPNNYVHQINTSYYQNGETLSLPAGTYYVYVTIETEYPGTPWVSFNLNFSKNPYQSGGYQNYAYGGIRIKSMQSKSYSSPDEITSFSYNWHDGSIPNSVSSGQFSLRPDYMYTNTQYNTTNGFSSYINYNSASNYPLLQTNGAVMGYKNVTVLYGTDGQNGKKEFTYTGYSDHGDILDLGFPYPSAVEYDWKRGLVTKETIYAKNGSAFVPVQRKEYAYEFHSSDTTRKYVSSIKIGKNHTEQSFSGDSYDILGIVYAGYRPIAEAFNIRRETVYDYDQINGSIIGTTQSEFNYNNKNFQQRRGSVNTSKGDSLITYTYYPVDYNATNTSASGKFLKDLTDANMVSTPIEQLSTKVSNAGENIIGGTLTTFKSDVLAPDKISRLILSSPLALSSFAKSYVDGSNQLNYSSLYKPTISFDQYHSNGKPTQLRKVDDISHAYIYGYKAELVIAEIANADIQSTAYSSFEEDGTGNWTYNNAGVTTATAVTGKKYYQLGYGNISKSGLSTGQHYIVSYWSNSGAHSVSGGSLLKSGNSTNGWVYYEYEVTGVSSISISGSGNIDEVRLYPKGAEMKSYTYEPLLGVATVSDTNGRILYYEYDANGRLLLIRDHQRNIIKSFCYNYSGQPIACDN